MNKIIDLMSFKHDWTEAIQSKNYKKIYLLLLQFFRKILPECENFEKSDDFKPIFEIINQYSSGIPKIIDLNFEKSNKIQNILEDYYSRAFNSPLLETNEDYERNLETSLKNLNMSEQLASEDKREKNNVNKIQNTNKKNIIIPKDSKQSTLFIKKTRELIEENVSQLLSIYKIIGIFNVNPGEKVLQNLKNLLIFLLNAFPDTSIGLINDLINFQSSNFISDETFSDLSKKLMDKLPHPIIFAMTNRMQEIIENSSYSNSEPDENELNQINLFLSIFEEYVEFYPNHFASNINFYYGLIGKYLSKEEITEKSIKILKYYAKHADERLNELFFIIYEKCLELVEFDKLTKLIVETLQEILSNGENFVFPPLYDEINGFGKDLKNLVYSQFSSNNQFIQEISFEIATSMWKFEIMNEYNLQDDRKTLNLKKKRLFKPIIKILKFMIKHKIDSPYLFMQAVKDCEDILLSLDKNLKQKDIYSQFLNEKTLNSSQKLFNTISKFINLLK